MKYFFSSIIVAIIGVVLAFLIGDIKAVYIMVLLAVLEISLSFDNAVVNAKVLETMDIIWQKRFITFGIPIAVFGMRFLFPILIVCIVGGLGFFETFNIALNDSKKYESILISSEKLIFAFGSSFLLMVFLDFFFDEDREIKWIHIIENNKTVAKMQKINNIELIIAIFIGLILVDFTKDYSIALAYFIGIFLHSLINALDKLLGTNGVRSGVIGFLYLEMLDASFSFDGVIGAFALSSNVFIIMIGLGVGAMFVRSLTIYLVEKKTLKTFIYLEHGAHYAILLLAVIMLMKMFMHVSEFITGTIGIAFILTAIIHSILKK